MSVKVSVVVPVYNTAKYLKKCLDSLVGQSMKGIEIVVVNNNSPDNAAGIIDEYAKQYPKMIKPVFCAKVGVSAARNAGIRVASGDFVGFVDSDDYVEPDMYEKMYAATKSDKAGLVVCGANKYFSNGTVKYFRALSGKNKNKKKDYVMSAFGPCAVIIKRRIVIDNKLFFREGIIYEDAAIVPAYVLYADKMSVVDEPVYNYVERKGSIMGERPYNSNLNDIFIALEDLRDNFERARQLEKYHDEIEYVYIGSLLYSASNRFMKYRKAGKNFRKVRKAMKTYFPHWRRNKYYQEESFKFKVICNLHYYLQQWLLRILTRTKQV